MLVQVDDRPPIAVVSLNDPAKRNALGLAMFDELDTALTRIAGEDSIHIVLLRGEGSVFCAGFDLAAAQRDIELLPQYIMRLSATIRAIRRLPQVTVAAVQGGAIAGGCALLSACDFVFVSPQTKLGYPVHRVGVSPAVTIPTLHSMIGFGAARSLLMSGELLGGEEAHRIGLATHLSGSEESVQRDARFHCESLSHKGLHALRVTKAWLNELDGSLNDDDAFIAPARDSARLSRSGESQRLLANWRR